MAEGRARQDALLAKHGNAVEGGGKDVIGRSRGRLGAQPVADPALEIDLARHAGTSSRTARPSASSAARSADIAWK